MQLHDLKIESLKNKKPKRKGRGSGSGNGKTGGHGNKGAGQRSGINHYAFFEGGQMPLYRKLPKKGFSNFRFKVNYQVLNVGQLESFEDGEDVNALTLYEYGLIRKPNEPIKILGDGELTKKLNIDVEKVSKTALEKITKAGGKIVNN